MTINDRITLIRIVGHILFKHHRLTEHTRVNLAASDDPRTVTYTCSCGLSAGPWR